MSYIGGSVKNPYLSVKLWGKNEEKLRNFPAILPENMEEGFLKYLGFQTLGINVY